MIVKSRRTIASCALQIASATARAAAGAIATRGLSTKGRAKSTLTSFSAPSRTLTPVSLSWSQLNYGFFSAVSLIAVGLTVNECAGAKAAARAATKTSAAHAALGGERVVLYQYDVCPFCNKVKAFLDYHKVPYDVVEVNPLTKRELSFSKDGYSKVPILMVGHEQLNDSTAIMAELTKRFHLNSTNSWSPSRSNSYVEKEREWLDWVDKRFVHVLTPNIYRTWSEAVNSFDYITKRGNFGFFERESVRWIGAASMYFISHRVLKKRHGIEDERAELYFELNKFISQGVAGQKYCGGNAPNNADLAMFGVLRAVKTFETFEDVMSNTSCEPWFERMKQAVGSAMRTDGVEN